MELQVRPATKTDLLRIHEMDIESYGPQTTPITALIWLVERQASPPSLFLSVGEVMEEGNAPQVAGFAAWKEVEHEPGSKTLEILHLVVGKHYRKEGLGEELLSRVLNEAKARGLRGASMTVPSSYDGAIHLLTKLGFTEYQRVPDYYQALGEGIVFAKVLNFPV